MLRLAFLGPPSVELDGEAAHFDTAKSVALLGLLSVSSPRTRDGLTAMLWPEADDNRGRSSLRRTLSVTAAGAGPALTVSRTTIGLDPAATWCDLWEFERLALPGDETSLEAAASLYRGDFLEGLRPRAGAEFDHWWETVAEEQRQRLASVLARLVDVKVAAGDLDGAGAASRRWLTLDPLHEPAQQSTMRVLAWSGQRTAALAQFRSYVRLLEEELGVEPLPETTALYEDIRANRSAAPAASRRAGPVTGRPVGGPPTARPADVMAGIPLVGRGPLVGQLREEVAASREGGRVAVVVGPGGSGKTRLVDALRADGLRWVGARCHEGERWLELGCVAELLRSALSVRPDLPDRLGSPEVAELARVVPELARRLAPPEEPLGSPGAQLRFFASVSTALADALGGGSGVLCVEDAQHIDESSARFLAYLAHRLDGLEALVLLTWQPDPGPPPVLSEAVEALGAARSTVVHPPAFGPQEVAEVLAAAGLDPGAAPGLVTQTGGLPLLVVAYAEAMRQHADGGEGRRGADVAELPAGVRQLLGGRLAAATGTTVQVVTAAAVLGSGADADLLRATSGRSPSEIADALDEGLARGLLIEGPSGEAGTTYEFPFEAMRHTAYDACGRARRRLLHGRAGEALARRAERTGGSTLCAAVSHHLELAGRPAEAAAWSWRASQRSLALFAHTETVDHLRRALDLGHRAVDARTALADSLTALGRYREALGQLEHVAADPGATPAERVAVEHRLASLHDRLGNWPLAAAHLETAIEQTTDPVVVARLLADRAFIAYRRREDTAGELAAAALAAARSSGDGRALAQATNVAGVLAAVAGDEARAEQQLMASLEAAELLGEPGPQVAARNNLARVLADRGRHDEAMAQAAAALEAGREHGDVHRLAALHSNLADLLHAAGRSDEAIAHLKESAATFSQVDAGDGATPAPAIWTLTEW